MKQTLLFYTLILSCFISYAQAPEKMSYQAIIRDAGNAVVTNATIGMQISILKETVGGTAVYVETQTPSTNINGVVSIKIGEGSVVSGTFSAIDWSNDNYFIKTETDPAGGTNYSITGTSQLLSVPYALFAKSTKAPIVAVMTDQITRNVDQNPAWTLGPTFTTVNGFNKGSFVKLSYIVPSRNDSGSSQWGGLYIEPQISFNDGATWSSLGSSGFDGGIMVQNSPSIGSYTNTLLINPLQTSTFSVKIRFYYRSYLGVTIINSNNAINSISGTATLMPGENGLQHFTKVIVEEIFQ